MEIKEIELKIQNLIALRTGYNAIVIVLTCGLISILFDITVFKGFLFCIGTLLDYLYLTKAQQVTKQIDSLIKKVGLL